MSTTPTVVSPSSTSPTRTPSSGPSVVTLQRLKIHTPEMLDALCAQEAKKAFVVEGLISAGSVGIAVGDSGIGKSPLFYQLALSVAAGEPWLGMRTSGGSVVYLDCENGAMNSRDVRDSLLQLLGLQNCPQNFFLCCDISGIAHLKLVVDEIKPALVVIDTLRSFDSTAEKDNTAAGLFIKSLRQLATTCKTAFLLIHHVKKQDGGFLSGASSLERDPLIQWLNQACGARGLINQTDVRIGVDHSAKCNASLIVRANRRVQGEVGPFYLERILDEDQVPIGYRRLFGIEFLTNPDQKSAFEKLPVSFSFKEAKTAYERQGQATNDFLQKCLQLGIVRKLAKGRYEKVSRTEPE